MRRLCSALSATALGGVGFAAIGAGVSGVYAGRQLLRGGAPPLWLPLAPGVVYERRLLAKPRRVAIHRVVVDLANGATQIVVTPARADDEYPYRAQTTKAFLDEHGLVAAVNGDYFAPWHCHGPFNYSPKLGEPVYALGPAAAHGAVQRPLQPGYFARRRNDCTWYFGADNRISTTEPNGPICSAISGGPVLLRSGLPANRFDPKTNPQTALAVDRGGRQLWMVVVDGRQPGHSEGLTDGELAEWLIEAGAWHALRLDGGGSSTMAIRTIGGHSRVANSPVHAGIPGWERPVANHLGIRLL